MTKIDQSAICFTYWRKASPMQHILNKAIHYTQQSQKSAMLFYTHSAHWKMDLQHSKAYLPKRIIQGFYGLQFSCIFSWLIKFCSHGWRKTHTCILYIYTHTSWKSISESQVHTHNQRGWLRVHMWFNKLLSYTWAHIFIEILAIL